MGNLDVDLAVLVQVMLIVNIVDMGLHSVSVVSGGPAIRQLADMEILCSVVFLSALEVHLEEWVVVPSAPVPLLQALLSELNIVQVGLGWLLLQLRLFLVQELGVRDGSLAMALERWQLLLLLSVQDRHLVEAWKVLHWAMVPPNSVLNLELVKPPSLVEGIRVVAAPERVLARRIALALCSVWRLCVVALSVVVDEPFPFKEVFAPSLILSICALRVRIALTLIRVVLNID